MQLGRLWLVGEQIGSGGFGKVYEATCGGDVAVVKFVPKAPGAEREMLFVDLGDVQNVVPIIDSVKRRLIGSSLCLARTGPFGSIWTTQDR